jgi:uncharacterized membrane protein (DUF4010 family)
MVNLLLAVAVGLIIGIERGWHVREAADGARIAGLRTFALLGLLGGVCALLAQQTSFWVLALALLGLCVVLAVGHYRESEQDGEKGITTVVAALLTFALAALATSGARLEAIAMAVLTAALLSLKSEIHGWLRRIERLELHTALQLLLVAVVVLPLLPGTAMGPWDAIVPRQIGWLVLMIAGLSFAGYIAVKLIGARYGLLAMGALGGMASSTAMVLQLSSRMREASSGRRLIAAAMLAACSVMAPRVLVLTALIAPGLLSQLALPVAAMSAPLLIAILYQMQGARWQAAASEPVLSNPMSLLQASKFALLIAAVMVLVQAARHWLGDSGVLVAAALSGVADADAISLSLAEMAGSDAAATTLAARGILIALMVNNAVKATFAVTIARGPATGSVALPLGLSGLIGGGFALAL